MNAAKLKFLYPAIIVICTFTIFRFQVFFERTWIFLITGFLLTFFYSGKYYRSKVFGWGLLYLLIVFLDFLMGDKMFDNLTTDIFNEVAMLILPTAITYSLIKKNDFLAIRNIVVVFFCFFIFTTLSSFIISLTMPGAIRRIVSLGYLGENTTAYNYLYRLGLSNYFLPHAAPVLIPAVYLGATNKSLNKKTHWFLWVMLACLIVLSYLSGATTALLLSIIVLLTMFVIKKGSFTKNLVRIGLIFIIVIPLLANRQIMSNLSNVLVSITADTDFQGKALEFQSTLEYNDISGGDAEERIELYTESWNGFLESILFGTNKATGSHSSLLDRLAHLGLLGLVPFFLFIIAQMKMIKKYTGNNLFIYYFLGMLLFILMISLKNMYFWEMAIIAYTILPFTIIVYGKGNEVS